MRRRVVVLLVVLLAVLAAFGCGTATAPQGADTPAARFADPSLAGLCEAMTVDVSATEPGVPTRDDAVARFVAMHAVLEGTTVSGEEIHYGGETAGRLTVSETPAGGYYVEHAEWCYPD